MLFFAGPRSSLPRFSILASFSLATSLFVGCGETESPGPDAPAPSISGETPAESDEAPAPVAVSNPSTDEVKRIENGKGYDLSTGRELPNLKAGNAKVTVSAPKGWVLPTRRQEYVVWFAKELGQEFPRVLVAAEPAPAGTPDTTEANVGEFARQVAAKVSKPLESPKPMIVGDVACVRYVSEAKSRSSSLEEQVLKTVQKGQLFTVTLQAVVVKPGESPLPQYRDAGYAVLASMKVEAGSAPPESPAAPASGSPAAPAAEAPAPEASAPAASDDASAEGAPAGS
jgi:hypothetical protein